MSHTVYSHRMANRDNRQFIWWGSSLTFSKGHSSCSTPVSCNSTWSWICNFPSWVGQGSDAWVVALHLKMQTRFYSDSNYKLSLRMKSLTPHLQHWHACCCGTTETCYILQHFLSQQSGNTFTNRDMCCNSQPLMCPNYRCTHTFNQLFNQ